MSIKHKFQDFDWGNGFFTKNATLHTPYEPEVIFIGTFNHGWDWNPADFFYGRSMYMWPILANLFLYNRNLLAKPRNEHNNNPPLSEIFKICQKGKIAFADIVSGVNKNTETAQERRLILVNEQYRWNNYSDKQLNFMGNKGWLDSNVKAIAKYINDTKSIKHIYFTFKSESWLIDKQELIASQTRVQSVGSIFTPTGMGFRRNLKGFDGRCSSLAHSWVWNGLCHKIAVNKQGYLHLDHQWLTNSGVDVHNF